MNNIGQSGRLESLTTGTLQDLSYVYDSVGNLTQITNTPASETNIFGYDALNRLTSWTLNGQTKTYGYDNAGNLSSKEGVTLNYNDANHVHAVSSAGSNSYSYDANGNQTTRVIGSDTFNLTYDAENRLVEVKKNNTTISLFTYDGDGKRVKSIVNGETILFIGGYYEQDITASPAKVTKYYLAGATRIAMRKYTIPQSMNVEYTLGDHLGSTSITTDALGNKVSELRYTPWGEVRYSWIDPALVTTPDYELSKYTFTGQYSYMEDLALMFYNARFYDPAIGRFAGADTIIPDSLQGLDRYNYTSNHPIVNIDPTGHQEIRGGGSTTPSCYTKPSPNAIDSANSYVAVVDDAELTHPNIHSYAMLGFSVQNYSGSRPLIGHAPCWYAICGFYKGRGLGFITDAQMITDYGVPVDGYDEDGKPIDEHGFGLGLTNEMGNPLNQDDPLIASRAMARRIQQVLNKYVEICGQRGCVNPTNSFLIAALAENSGFYYTDVKELINGVDPFDKPDLNTGLLDWDNFLESVS
ncbi:MAG: hypothetical protein HFACDABA_02479 [Anaerolineales bacterium]|nr:hypothetical protein [Anaerolineales bacterium]